MLDNLEVNGIIFDKISSSSFIPYIVSFDISCLLGGIGVHELVAHEKYCNIMRHINADLNTALYKDYIKNAKVSSITDVISELPLVSQSLLLPCYDFDNGDILSECLEKFVTNLGCVYNDYPSPKRFPLSRILTHNFMVVIKDKILYNMVKTVDIMTVKISDNINTTLCVLKTHDIESYQSIISRLDTIGVSYTKTISGNNKSYYDISKLSALGRYNRILFNKSTKGKTYIEMVFIKKDIDLISREVIEDFLSDYMSTYKHRTKVRNVDDRIHINITNNMQSIIDFMTLMNIIPSYCEVNIDLYELHNLKERSEIFNDLYIG